MNQLKKEIIEILRDVYYWECCPQEYNDRIDIIIKEINKDE